LGKNGRTKYQISRKSTQWQPCWYMPTDMGTGKRTDGHDEVTDANDDYTNTEPARQSSHGRHTRNYIIWKYIFK
jgi:hypothetical protein